ncbi:hypothetical protein MMC17_009822 [Xylographa soralifera]|nr:hypothetical protein [Xylographa soralifera]
MGGFLLQTTDEAPFPIDAKQLYYLLANDYLEYPSIDLVEIDDKNKTDGFARVLTIGQVLWFVVNCIGRGIQRLSTTTLELTTVGFVFCMLFTSLCWRHKPTGIKRPITLRCKTTVERILLVAGDGAKERYRYTPLDFVSRKEWSFSLFWAYDQNILRCLHLPIFGRSSTTLPRNRIPNANWPELDTLRSAYAWILSLVYGTIFVVCWNFAFPSDVERLLWRISSVGTMAIVVFGPIFEYCFIRNARFPEGLPHTPLPMENDPEYGSGHRGWIGIQAFKSTVRKVAASLRNNSLNQDPALTVPLRALIPLTILCAIYTIFRAYILIEDVLSLRLLPASTFETVSWAGYLPHI